MSIKFPKLEIKAKTVRHEKTAEDKTIGIKDKEEKGKIPVGLIGRLGGILGGALGGEFEWF